MYLCGYVRTKIMYFRSFTVMKKLSLFFLLMMMLPGVLWGQSVEYQTFIYTSDDLAAEIQRQSDLRGRENRGFWGDMLGATLDATKGIASGYVTTFVDLGINAIGALITRNTRLKQEWEETVKRENVYTTTISTVSEVNDFYRETSFDGAMDPKGMRFDGIGCLRKEGNDTVFYISCHIDRSKIYRIINHSKFELVLDTLIVSPAHSNLPNTPLDIPFSFDERKNFNLSMNIRLTSSWMNEIVQLQKDQLLGEFTINVPVDRSMLDEKGFLRYSRKKGEPSAYKVVGESFIVPRSFMGYRDENDNYKNIWGTGEYKMSVELKETCDVTDQYRKNWKADRKRRQKMMPKDDVNIFAAGWQMVSNQRWDEITKAWVITTLKAPAGVLTTDVIEKLGLETKASQASKAGSQPSGGAQQGGNHKMPNKN